MEAGEEGEVGDEIVERLQYMRRHNGEDTLGDVGDQAEGSIGGSNCLVRMRREGPVVGRRHGCGRAVAARNTLGRVGMNGDGVTAMQLDQ